MAEGIPDQTLETGHYTGYSRHTKLIYRIALGLILAICVLDIAGWITGIGWFKSLGHYWVPMQMIVALCFIVTSFPIYILFRKKPRSLKKYAPLFSGIFLIVVSVLTIISWTNSGSGHEASFSTSPLLSLFLSPDQIMPFLSALIFLTIGIILILLSTADPIAANISHFLLFPAAIAGYLIPISYILDVYTIHDFYKSPVALNSGIAFCAVSALLYLVRQDTWLMKVLLSRSMGGIMARKLFPWLLLFPVTVGWLRIYGENEGYYDSATGVLLVAITYTFSFILLVWFTARSLNQIDDKRQYADEALRKSNAELENRVRERIIDLSNLNQLLDSEIKERVRAENLVAAERTRIDGLLELMPAYLILLTPDHQVTYSNRYFRERFGQSSGRRCFEFLFNRSEPCEVCETFRVMDDNQPHTWEWTGPDNRVYSIFDFPYSDSDGSPLIMEMGIDITSLKEAESKLVTINAELENRVNERTAELLSANYQLKTTQSMAHLGSWEYDLVNGNLKWDDEVFNIFGVKPGEYHPDYSSFLDFVHPDDKEFVNLSYHDSIEKGLDTYEVEHRIIKRNTGEIRYLVEKSNHIKNKAGKIIKSLGMAHDVTERKLMELALEKNNERNMILSQTSGILLASENPQELINSLCLRVMKFLDCQVFFNFLLDDVKGRLHLNTYSGIPEESAKKIEWLDLGVAVCGSVARDGVRIIAENIPESTDRRTDLLKTLGIKVYACHPIQSTDKVIGTLSFGSTSRISFSEDEISMMKIVTEQVAIAMTRVRNNESLRKSEERYRRLMEMSPGASFVNRGGKIALVNSAAVKLFGAVSAKEILGKSPYEIFHPDYHSMIKERIQKILDGKDVPMAEEKIVRIDRVIRDVEVVSALITDSEGPAIQVIVSDITERKKAEKELSDTKNYLENLINYSNAPIIVWDQDNIIRLFNTAFEHLTGYSASEVEGKKLDLLFPKNTLKKSMEMIKDAVRENWVTIEIPILTKNKNIRTVLWNSAKIFDDINNTYSTIAQGNDITERIMVERALKESKEKLEIALENGNIGIWEWEIGVDKFKLDERMERMFGITPGSFDNTFEGFAKYIFYEDSQHFRNAFSQSIIKNAPVDTVFRIMGNDEERNYISAKGLVITDEEGNASKISGVCFDITDMKRGAEKTLFNLNEELLRSNRELEQFAYVASHDLQEPLRMVSSFTQLLSQRYKDKLDQDAQEFIQFAVDGAIRMQILINDLLDYSRIQTKGKRFVATDMHRALGQVLINLNLKIQEQSALITNDDLPMVIADDGQMVQLLQNLVGNALKFCNRTPRIHISAREENDHFLFSVKDNGIGIEPQYYNRIFQIFQRLHSRNEFGGTGIGLAICKRIIDRHGGKIWVESKPGKGSVFYFTLFKS